MENGKSYWMKLRSEQLYFAQQMLEAYRWTHNEIAIECYERFISLAEFYQSKADECKTPFAS